MSGIAGYYSRLGDKAGDQRITRLKEGLERRGRYPMVTHVKDGPTFVNMALRHPNQNSPEVWVQGADCIGWDGRLDNRDDLERLLAEPINHDLHGIVIAIRRWGVEGLDRVVGDHALAMWDGSQRRMILARDVMGVRPLFYVQRGQTLFWASTLQSLLAATNLNPKLNDDWIAGYFAHAIDGADTPFEEIKVVLPGHAVIFDGERTTHCRFSSLKAAVLSGSWDDRDYELGFKELFEEAILCRLGSEKTVGAELSGGLDSSSIVCVADATLKKRSPEINRLFTISHTYPKSRTSDERDYIHLIERQIGRQGFHISETDNLVFKNMELSEYDAPTDFECIKEKFRRMSQYMNAQKADVLFSGFAGDHLVHAECEPDFPLADLIRSGKLRTYASDLRDWHKADGTPYPALFVNSVATAIAPGRHKRKLLSLEETAFEAIASGFRRRTGFTTKLAAPANLRGPGYPSKRLQFTGVSWAVQNVGWLYDYSPGPRPFEVVYPFLHRPLVEFCMAVPSSQFIRPGETRSLHRRALRSYLPVEIARRKDKCSPNESLSRDIATHWQTLYRLSRSMRVVEEGIVSQDGFDRTLEKARWGQAQANIPLLLKIFGLEIWLRGFEEKRTSGTRTYDS